MNAGVSSAEEDVAIDEIQHLDRDLLHSRLPRTSRTIGISSPRRRMRLISDAVFPSRPFLPQSTTMQPMAASVWTAISASSVRRAWIT